MSVQSLLSSYMSLGIFTAILSIAVHSLCTSSQGHRAPLMLDSITDQSILSVAIPAPLISPAEHNRCTDISSGRFKVGLETPAAHPDIVYECLSCPSFQCRHVPRVALGA